MVSNALSTFDDFVDDILCADIDLLSGELDFLIIQHLFQSIDLNDLNIDVLQDNDYFAA